MVSRKDASGTDPLIIGHGKNQCCFTPHYSIPFVRCFPAAFFFAATFAGEVFRGVWWQSKCKKFWSETRYVAERCKTWGYNEVRYWLKIFFNWMGLVVCRRHYCFFGLILFSQLFGPIDLVSIAQAQGALTQDLSTQRPGITGPGITPLGLLNPAAAASAEKKGLKDRSRSSRTIVPQKAVESTAISDAADLDSVNEIIRDHQTTGGVLSPYRSPFYLSYVYDVVPIPDFEDWSPRSEAERLLFYQSAVSLTKLLINSELEPIYRDVVKSLHWLRDYTTLHMTPEHDGGLQVANGKSTEKPWLELKLHLSSNRGLEPRIKFGDSTTLRYGIFDNDLLVEYQREF